MADQDVFQLISDADLSQAEKVFTDIQETVRIKLVSTQLPAAVPKLIANMVSYNTFGGKKIRLQMTLAAFRNFAPSATSDELYLAFVLGWITEIFQGAACVMDDVIDKSTQRRGKPCWHLLPQVGTLCVLDVQTLVLICDLLLQNYFGEKPYYRQLLKIYNQVKWISLMGENLDSRFLADLPLEEFSRPLYDQICYGRTSCYTFYFPVAAALAMVPDHPLDFGVVELAAAKLGYFYSVQDDFIDVYGDPNVTGKIGSDIQEHKCSWLVVKALELGDAQQRETLESCYGSSKESCVARVKRTFEEIGIPDAFRAEMEDVEKLFNNLLSEMTPAAPVGMYRAMFQMLKNRRR